MEIDLTSNPPQLWLIGEESGRPRRLSSQPLGLDVRMTDALRLICRMRLEASSETSSLRLRAFGIDLGRSPVPADRMKVGPWQEGPNSPYLLAVCSKGELGRSGMHFLPPSTWGWTFEKVIHSPSLNDAKGAFQVQMLSRYWGKDAHGHEHELGKRFLVRVDTENMDIKSLAAQLHYDLETNSWSRP
jgi:hypothetical protein